MISVYFRVKQRRQSYDLLVSSRSVFSLALRWSFLAPNKPRFLQMPCYNLLFFAKDLDASTVVPSPLYLSFCRNHFRIRKLRCKNSKIMGSYIYLGNSSKAKCKVSVRSNFMLACKRYTQSWWNICPLNNKINNFPYSKISKRYCSQKKLERSVVERKEINKLGVEDKRGIFVSHFTVFSEAI